MSFAARVMVSSLYNKGWSCLRTLWVSNIPRYFYFASVHRNNAKFKLQVYLCSQKSNSYRVLLESYTTYVWIIITIISCRSNTNICCNKNILYTGCHGVVSIRHNFVCNHKRCKFLVFRNFARGKINALQENLSERQFFKYIFEYPKRIERQWDQLRNNKFPCSCMSWLCHFPYNLGPLPNIQLIIICIATSQEYAI